MAVGGGKPGTTVKLRVVEVTGDKVSFVSHDPNDAQYFEVGNEYVGFFQPAPPEHPSSGEGEQGNG